MIKKINYLFQALLIYIFFFIGRILGIKISKKIFSIIFFYLGPLFKSKEIIKKNIKTFSQNISSHEEEKIIENMWKNYGMTLLSIFFLIIIKRKNLT